MNCHEALTVIRDYIDDELASEYREPLESHLSSCEACSRIMQEERELKSIIRTHFPKSSLPVGLTQETKDSIRASVEWQRRRVLVAAVLAALIVPLWIWLSRSQGEAHPRLVRELVDDHIRNLSVERPHEFATADHVEAERWFGTQLDVAVALPVFQDLTLIGARRCYVLDRRSALLFYRRGSQRLSLFVMNSGGLDFEDMTAADLAHADCAHRSYKGFKVVAWKSEGLLYAFVATDRRDELVAVVAAACRR